MNDILFWAMIESAWEAVSGRLQPRQNLFAEKLSL